MLFFFYLNYFLISRIEIIKYRYVVRAIILLLLLLGYLVTDHVLMMYFHDHNIDANQYIPELKSFVTLRTIRFLYLMSISYTYWLVEYRIKTERDLVIIEKKRVIELEKMSVLEKEKVTHRTQLPALANKPAFYIQYAELHLFGSNKIFRKSIKRRYATGRYYGYCIN